MTVILTGGTLTLDEVVRVARERERVGLSGEALERARRGRETIEHAVGDVYGLTTGVGVRKRNRVADQDQGAFNRRLILDHRVGQGDAAAEEVVRAMTLRLANGFARGTAGVRLELLERVVDALNEGVVPRVRMLGSLGQSDLPSNADLAYGLLGDFELVSKEGIALLNHNAFSTAIAALAVTDTSRLLDGLDAAGALDLEAFAANLSVLDQAVARHRPYPGLRNALERLRRLLDGSYLWDEGVARNLQDPLSFRTLPQVHGAARDALTFVEGQLGIELNASQENPLVDGGRIISVGNFDVLPLAAALDFLRIALAPALTSASERAVKLLQAPLTGLPEGLAEEDGLPESAFSEFGVPLQAIAAEARLLAAPVSVEHGSSFHHEGIEDRMTLAPLAGRRLAEQVDLGARVVAIELVIAAQAVDRRGRPRLGRGTAAVYEAVRARVCETRRGEPPPQDLEPLWELVRTGDLLHG